jgi:hypothetical protein
MTTDTTNATNDTSSAGDLDLVLIPRRRLLANSLAMPLMLTAWSLDMPRQALAAVPAIPAAVRRLDSAAMALFDAAESASWTEAASALGAAKAAALGVSTMERDFVDAGGGVGSFIEVQNNLSADLIEAGTALSAQDKRWLVSASDRVATRAGELSQPFAEAANAVTPRVETLLFLDRRMRRALVWKDDGGYRDARDAFNRVWSSLRGELVGRAPAKVQALDQALISLGVTTSPANLKTLYLAIDALRDATS